jgi:hypothetical protein
MGYIEGAEGAKEGGRVESNPQSGFDMSSRRIPSEDGPDGLIMELFYIGVIMIHPRTLVFLKPG